MATQVEIDDSLYSRQRYVLGDSAMQRMAKSNVLLYGMGGLGVEIAKNIILAGIKSLTIQDSKVATFSDLGTQFFLRNDDVMNSRNRAEASSARLAELNPYVSVKTNTSTLDESTSLSYLTEFQCVILTEASLNLQLRVDEFCRSHQPPIQFICADVYGVFCWSFCDFGDNFEVVDTNGEEPKEVFISKVTKGNPAEVTTLENKMHGFEDGDTVTFREVKGMEALNNNQFKIKVLSPYAFTIGDTTGDEFGDYDVGGIATQVKIPKTLQFQSLDRQLKAPSLLVADLCKFDVPINCHVGMCALQTFRHQYGRLPNIRCDKDAEEILQMAREVNDTLDNKVESIDHNLLKNLSYTSKGCFAPLCAALGGIVAQEALKALTGKFTPLQQWFYLEACEVLSGLESADLESFIPRQNRYDTLRVCLGEELCQKLADLRLFMVGCGAIGCEMLKNYAMLGTGTTDKGLITITDNDLIEKSNLNRQFLFRPHHIQQPKSTTAAASSKEINPDLRIEAQQHKVCPQTEHSVYTDHFFLRQNIVVNALDNVEARRYVDSRCVTNQRALLESGTMGAKGHVQVVVPHLSESYNNQRDPPDEDVPYCTLKSFPAVIEHCIQWARDKFESSFTQKPSMFNKFWSNNPSPQDVIQKLQAGIDMEGVTQVSKLCQNRPITWQQCVALARVKFEKYFNHKAKNLLHAFPLDTRLQDGSLFWQSPKRPPTPQDFDAENPVHLHFIMAAAKLYAEVANVKYSPENFSPESVKIVLPSVNVPAFRPSSKKIETDESASKPQDDNVIGDELTSAAARIHVAMEKAQDNGVFGNMQNQSFEKDDDSNGHIDFITAASNLRAAMYSIEPADRLKTKRIAGRIVPAIATTTAAVAGLVSVELVKLVKQASLSDYKNCFLNLAIPVVLFSEPGPAEVTTLSNGTKFTQWDKWEVKGNKGMTVQQFLDTFQEKFKLEVNLIVQNTKMIYVPFMPGHAKRLPQAMLKFVKPTPDKDYVDLNVSFAGTDDDEMGPPVRYFHGA